VGKRSDFRCISNTFNEESHPTQRRYAVWSKGNGTFDPRSLPLGATPPVVLDPPSEDYHYLLDESRFTALLPDRLNVRACDKTSQFLVALQLVSRIIAEPVAGPVGRR
jgi:hypothetical protein